MSRAKKLATVKRECFRSVNTSAFLDTNPVKHPDAYYSPEDIEEGRRSQRNVATLRFNAAVFGHGRPIHSGASERIRTKWGG